MAGKSTFKFQRIRAPGNGTHDMEIFTRRINEAFEDIFAKVYGQITPLDLSESAINSIAASVGVNGSVTTIQDKKSNPYVSLRFRKKDDAKAGLQIEYTKIGGSNNEYGGFFLKTTDGNASLSSGIADPESVLEADTLFLDRSSYTYSGENITNLSTISSNGIIDALTPKQFKREDGKIHYGFVASEIKNALNALGISNSAIVNGDFVSETELIALLVMEIKNLKNKV